MKNKIQKIIFAIIMFIVVIFIKNNSKATNISISPSNPKVGDTITVTVSVPNVHTVDVTANVSGVISGTIKVVGGDLAGVAKDYSNSAQYKCTKEGTVTVGISSSSTAVLNGEYVKNLSATKTITVASNQTSSGNSNSGNSGSTTTQQPQTPTKSNVATLSNLGIRPNDFSGFKANTLTYNTEVPYETDKIEIYASKGQSGQTISGTGTKTLKEGQNTFNITVTAEDGKTTKTYILNITRKQQGETQEPEEPVEENPEVPVEAFGLSELKIEGLELNPEFQTDIYEYKIDLTEDIEKLNITAYPTHPDTIAEITGNENLIEGENIITIVVKPEDEEDNASGNNIATYQIIVNKTLPKEEVENTEEGKIDKKVVLISAGAVILVIVVIFIIIKKRKNKDDSEYVTYTEFYAKDMEEISEDEQIRETEEDDFEGEVKKQKRSKGKRFK